MISYNKFDKTKFPFVDYNFSNDNYFNQCDKITRLYDLNFSNINQLFNNNDIVFIGYRYKESGGKEKEYLFIDITTNYFYTIEEESLEYNFLCRLRNLSLYSNLTVFSDLEYPYYFLTSYSTEKIFPYIDFLDEKDKKSDDNVKFLFCKKLSRCLSKGPFKVENGVKCYYFNENPKSGESSELSTDLKSHLFYISLGIAAGNMISYFI